MTTETAQSRRDRRHKSNLSFSRKEDLGKLLDRNPILFTDTTAVFQRVAELSMVGAVSSFLIGATSLWGAYAFSFGFLWPIGVALGVVMLASLAAFGYAEHRLSALNAAMAADSRQWLDELKAISDAEGPIFVKSEKKYAESVPKTEAHSLPKRKDLRQTKRRKVTFS